MHEWQKICITMRIGHTYLVLIVALTNGIVPSVRSGGCPYHCTCTPPDQPTTVSCVLGDLKDFPENLPLDVEYLSVADNWIQNLPQLSKYTKLRVFSASGNRISKIHETTFQGLRSLQYIDLSSNIIGSLTDINAFTVFKSNEQLDTLNLTLNTIKNFNEESNIVSSSLKILDISSNSISTLDKSTLDGLPSLTHLNVSRNPLKWAIGLRSSTLTYLDMSYGQMDVMNRDELEGMPQLNTLIISRNKKYNLYFRDVVSKSLRNYHASFCELSSPGLFDFPNLEIANLRGNKIEVLRTKALINNKKLTRLDLSSNGLKEIESDSFLGLVNIEHLNLGDNIINALTWDMLITNHELKFLNLSNNPITKLPENFTMSKLKELDLSQCQIHLLDIKTLTRLPFLSKLNLSRNVIEQIPNFLESNSLKTFDVSFGRLTSINNETFSKIPNLETLNLMGNRFTNVPTALMFSSNTLLKSIQLSDNPWICECKNNEFKIFWQFLTEQPSKIKNSERNLLKCMSPPNLSGNKWEDACYLYLYPPAKSASFFDHYGVYILIAAMTISFLLVISLSIRKKMRKREKAVERSRLEERRRTSRELQERMVRQYRESTEIILEGADSTEDSTRQERALSQPPTYEEAVLMPRRVQGESSEELDQLDHSRYEMDMGESETLPVIEVESREEVTSLLRRSSNLSTPTRDAPKPTEDSDGMADYDEVTTDSGDEEEVLDNNIAGAVLPRIEVQPSNDYDNNINSVLNVSELDEAKLMELLKIEVWSPSSEDVNALQD